MNKLSKEQLTARDTLCEALRTSHAALTEALEAFNNVMDQAWPGAEEALADYNHLVAQANAWLGEIAGEMQEYMDERSEKWQESERGQAYDGWRQEFEDELEEIELERPKELTLETDDQAERLEGCAEEFSG